MLEGVSLSGRTLITSPRSLVRLKRKSQITLHVNYAVINSCRPPLGAIRCEAKYIVRRSMDRDLAFFKPNLS